MINRQSKLISKLNQSFTCDAGVKQGCMLSPTLFSFYLSDLPKFLNTASSNDIMLSDKSINCLLLVRSLKVRIVTELTKAPNFAQR